MPGCVWHRPYFVGLPVGGFIDEVVGVSSPSSLSTDSSSLLRSHAVFPLCKPALRMRNGFLQLVARWLAAQTGLFLGCFWGDVCNVCFALVLQHFRHVFS